MKCQACICNIWLLQEVDTPLQQVTQPQCICRVFDNIACDHPMPQQGQ